MAFNLILEKVNKNQRWTSAKNSLKRLQMNANKMSVQYKSVLCYAAHAIARQFYRKVKVAYDELLCEIFLMISSVCVCV